MSTEQELRDAMDIAYLDLHYGFQEERFAVAFSEFYKNIIVPMFFKMKVGNK